MKELWLTKERRPTVPPRLHSGFPRINVHGGYVAADNNLIFLSQFYKTVVAEFRLFSYPLIDHFDVLDDVIKYRGSSFATCRKWSVV